ncbi:MAG: ATP-dependent DNA helicase [Lautropia sp.]|nr:ATP-dependent DNA helicase [Lautropia sp.]
MAVAIANAIVQDEVLMVDAGTGIGKTFAYLVPTMLSGRRALVSTATRQLQDQLFQKDVQRIRQALGLDVSVAILKGRANYVCPVQLEKNLSDGRFRDPRIPAKLKTIERQFLLDQTGDKAAYLTIPEEDPVWALATSTRDNCLGQDCPELRNCPLMKARQQAQKADLLIVNHHLFCADLALQDESIGDFLPEAEVLVFDEAHQLPEIATEFFGESVSTRQIIDLGRETLKEGLLNAAGLGDWQGCAHKLQQVASRLRLSLPAGITRLGAEELLSLTAEDVNEWLEDVLPDVIDTLHAQAAELKPVAETSVELARLEARATLLAKRLTLWLRAFRRLLGMPDNLSTEVATEQKAQDNAHEVSPPEDGPNSHAAETQPAARDETILWAQTTDTHAQLRATPLSVAPRFAYQRKAQGGAWIFVSATLALQGKIDHFAGQIGLRDARQLIVDSPFDYARQAALWVPREAGNTSAPTFPGRVADTVWPLIRKNRGRAFVLCTTLRAVKLISERLRDLADEEIRILAQGDAPRHQLIEQFKAVEAGVLVGSAGFWEGVDIAGDKLSLVIIDKLPFTPPDDPVFRARSRALTEAGHHPFQLLALPQAMLALKQGTGRLIRRETDHGLLVICDERLLSKSYGRQILASLPPFQRVNSLTEALDALEPPPADADL